MLSETISISPPVFDPIVAFGIGGLAVTIAAVWVFLFSSGSRRRLFSLSLAAAALLVASAVAALSGKLSHFDSVPPPMAVMMAVIFAIGFSSGFSFLGRDAAAKWSFSTLFGLQAFRFPLELVMHHASSTGMMPVQLSYSGYNFDIVTGVSALIIAALLKSGISLPRFVVWLWNLWGSYCLVAIAVIAITASPMVRLFGNEPHNLNTWVLFFPYVWLPVVLVPAAISGHVVIWRKLLTQSAT
jgi:hypothetical protein